MDKFLYNNAEYFCNIITQKKQSNTAVEVKGSDSWKKGYLSLTSGKKTVMKSILELIREGTLISLANKGWALLRFLATIILNSLNLSS